MTKILNKKSIFKSKLFDIIEADIECLLIDMDGVILDNAYDNDFWQNQIPEVIADNKGIAFDDA